MNAETKAGTLKIKEISWNDEALCLYCLGWVDKESFISAVQRYEPCDAPKEERLALTPDKVRWTLFRPMSPTEARRKGYDYGVMETTEGGYKVTEVKL